MGIPVIREDRSFFGVDVALNFGIPKQQFLRRMSLTEAARFFIEDQFPPGSMGPKVQAAMQFLQATGKRAVITSISAIEAAVYSDSGTEIVNE